MGEAQQQEEYIDKSVEEIVTEVTDAVVEQVNPAIEEMFAAKAQELEISIEDLSAQVAQKAHDKLKVKFANENALKGDESTARLRRAIFSGKGLKKAIDDHDVDGASFFRGVLYAKAAGGIEANAKIMAEKAGDHDAVKSLGIGALATGGATVPVKHSTEFIGVLRSKTVVRKLGARTIGMPGGQLTFGRQNGTPTAFWSGESSAIPVSQGEYGQLKLVAKKLAILISISNELIHDETIPAGIGAMVEDDAMRTAANAEDVAFLRGSGANTPTGIKGSVDASHLLTSSGATTENIMDDLSQAEQLVKSADIDGEAFGWVFTSRTEARLKRLRDANGWVYRDEMLRGTLNGHPYMTTNSIPDDLDFTAAGNANESEIYFGDFNEFVIGETLDLRVEEFNGASYIDENAQQVNGVQNDETVIRLTHRVDCALRHNRAFTVIQGVTYGAA